MKRRVFALAAAFACAHSVWAVELPSRNAKSTKADQKARECTIEGEQGVELPGGGCVRISGYVSTGVSAGNVKR
jgi:hypothetical protein